MRYASHVLLVALVVVALSFLCTGLSQLAWTACTDTFAAAGVSSLPYYTAWIVICTAFTLAYPAAAATPWRLPVWTRAGIATFAGVVALSIAMYLPSIRTIATGHGHVPAPLLVLAGGGIVGPLVEEWLFRGIVWTLLRRASPGRTGLVTALVGGALMFGFWHLPFDGVTAFGVQLAFLHAAFGIVMGVARWRLDSIWPGVLLHVLGNCAYIIASSP